MLVPEKLKRGDTVAIIAPSSPILEKDNEYIEESKRILESVRIKCRI